MVIFFLEFVLPINRRRIEIPPILDYMSLSDASKELMYLANLASTITEVCVPAKIFCDNTAAQTI
jgi:hypothetical protein